MSLRGSASGESIFRSDKGIARGISSLQVRLFSPRYDRDGEKKRGRKRQRGGGGGKEEEKETPLSGLRLDYDRKNSSDTLASFASRSGHRRRRAPDIALALLYVTRASFAHVLVAVCMTRCFLFLGRKYLNEIRVCLLLAITIAKTTMYKESA